MLTLSDVTELAKLMETLESRIREIRQNLENIARGMIAKEELGKTS